MSKFYKNKTFLHIVLITIISILVYINSFKNDFVYDDHTHILNNPEIRYFSNIPKFFASPFIGGLYRPLRTINYMVIYSLWGENPFGYHLNSLLLHVANIIIIYFITNLLLNKKNLSLITSLLFAIHPIHTERVTNITASFDQLGIFFIFLSFYLYLLYSKKEKSVYFLLSAIVFILALLSSEEAIVFPLLLVLYDVCFNKNNLKKKFKGFIVFFVIDLFYIVYRFFILGASTIKASEYVAGNFYATMLTMSKVFVKYIQLLFFPFRLTLYHHIITANSLFNIKVFLSLLILLFLIFIAIKSYKNNKIITFITGWFFITLIPFSNILPFRNLMAERYLYIPSFAFCLLLAIFIHKIYNTRKIKNFSLFNKARRNSKGISGVPEKPKVFLRIFYTLLTIKNNGKLIAIILFFILFVSYSTITIKRNVDWKDDLTLWTRTVNVSPFSSEAHDNLGFAYEQKGIIDKAIVEFKKSVELNPSNYKAYTNLGTSYGQKGNFSLAEKYLKIAIKIEPDYYKAYNYLGLIYAKQGLFNQSIIEFKKAIKTNPSFDEAYYNLGIVYEYLDEYNLAKQEFEKAFKLNPKDPIYIQKIKSIE